MSWANSLLTIAIVFSCLQAHAENRMYMFGGAGEPAGADNQFFGNFTSLSSYAETNNWNSQTLFGGDPAQDLARLQAATKLPAYSFSSQNLANALKQINHDANTGALTSKDKVLIVIDTHGSPMVTRDGHSLSCSDGVCSPQQLKKLIKNLESKNIPTAIVDLSCYSGNSQKLASDKTCVVSATRSDDVALATFAQNFISKMKPGKSLEEVFLQARSSSSTAGYPQISSPAGKSTEDIITTLSANSRYCAAMNICQVKANKQKNCQNYKSSSLDLVQNTQRAQEKTWAQDYITASQSFQRLNQEYQNLQKNYLKYASRVVTGDNNSTISWEALSDYQSAQDFKQLQNYPEIYNQYYQLQKSNPDYKKMLDLKARLQTLSQNNQLFNDNGHPTSENALITAARKSQEAEQKLYDKVYRNQTARSGQPNPCASFKL